MKKAIAALLSRESGGFFSIVLVPPGIFFGLVVCFPETRACG